VEGGSEIIGGTQKWVMSCNWKFASDNFSPDSYHFNITHIAALKVMPQSPSALQRRFNSSAVQVGYGHGTSVTLDRQPSPYPEVEAYHQAIQSERERHLGEVWGKRQVGVGTLFPNFSFTAFDANRTIRVWHPRGPNKTEAWSWAFVDKNAPKDVREATRLDTLRGQSGPGGMLEQDDGENWNMCTASQAGHVARRYDFNYQLQLNREHQSEDLPGVLTNGPSEGNQRNLYSFWADLMTSESWGELRGRSRKS
jgi:3-phenylpropionate/trans-cinnamate dioxygenase alpha subunit